MNPFEAMTAFWTAQGDTLAQAQSQMAEGLKAMMSGAMPAMPAQSGDIAAASADLADAGQSLMALWSSAAAMAGTLARDVKGALPAAAQDFSLEAMIAGMTDPATWLASAGGVTDALDRAYESPRLADLWEVERRYLRVLKAWMEVRQRGGAHQAVILKAWLQASERFREEIAGQAGVDGRLSDSRAMLTLWTETANRALLDTQCSDTFLNTQAGMVRATTELNLAQQDLVEYFGKQYGFPTRTELDDVHRTLTDLKREVRALRRGMRVPAPELQPIAAPPRPAKPAGKPAAVRPPGRPKAAQRIAQ